MGLFDIFKPKAKPGASSAPAAPQDKNVTRYSRLAADRHAQNYDRMEAIEALARIETSDAAAALLKRFTFYIEPSITDQEEREVAFRGIVACGEEAIEPILAFCARAESLTWPLKILREILEPEGFIEEVIELLSGFDTDYARNVDPKIQLLSILQGEKSDAACEEATRFLEDVNEPVRFQAAVTLLSSEREDVAAKLVTLAIEEESVRIRNKIAEGFAARRWIVAEADRDKLASAFRAGGFGLDREGRVSASLARSDSRAARPRTKNPLLSSAERKGSFAPGRSALATR